MAVKPGKRDKNPPAIKVLRETVDGPKEALHAIDQLEDFFDEALEYIRTKHYYDDITNDLRAAAAGQPLALVHAINVAEFMDRPQHLPHDVEPTLESRRELKNELRHQRERYNALLNEVGSCLAGHEQGTHEGLDHLAEIHPDLVSAAPAAEPDISGENPPDPVVVEHYEASPHTH